MSSTNNTVDYYTKGNDLYLKYFLIDSSFNNRGWSVDPSQIPRLAQEAIGKPFTDYEDFTVTPFNDGHPWSPKEKATFKDHLEHAFNKKTGIIVDFSPVSRNALKSASGYDIQQNHGYYVTVKVTDENKKQQYLDNPARIPRVSPGIYDYDFTKLPANNLQNIDFVHLAGVKYGAYGDKARVYAQCSGGYECLNHLKGASEIDSSLGNSSLNSIEDNIMVDNTNTNSNSNIDANAEPQPNTANDKIVETQQTQKPTTSSQSPIGIERLKAQKFEIPSPKEVKDFKEDPEFQKLLKEHEELKLKDELREKQKEYAEIIPRELFILNGKFDVTGYNKEIEKAVDKKLDPEYAKEYYSLKLKNIKLHEKVGKPFGASNKAEYKTPDTVPELKGASQEDNNDSSQFQSIINIRRMIGLGGNI